MDNNFQQTVNLKDEMERKKDRARARIKPLADNSGFSPKSAPKPRPKAEPAFERKKFIKRSKGIDEVYNDSSEEASTEKEMHKITRPIIKNSQELLYKRLSLALGAIVVLLAVYFMFFSGHKPQAPAEQEKPGSSWYRLELINKEVYYGQIDDTSADPVVIRKVYYNYDQLNKEAAPEEDSSGSLKLVKRGKEAYGPDDSMSIVRAQVIKMEELAEDSKVLKAILDYEK